MTYELKKDKIIENLKYSLVAFICFTMAFLVLCFPKQAGYGVTSAVELCLHTVIPSLFPFIFLSSLLVTSNLYQKLSKPLGALTKVIFRLPGESACIILMSLIGGYPVGTQMISSVYADGGLTENQAQRMSLFCVNAGPSFVINTVGYYMLGSRTAGIYMYISLVIACLLTGFLTRFIDDGQKNIAMNESTLSPISVSRALSLAAQQSPFSMLKICVWVVLFNCVIQLLGLNNPSFSSGTAVISLLEVTSGCKAACGIYSVPVICGIMGWGGLSVHCQIMPYNMKYGTDLKLFFVSRVICGAFASLICQALMRAMPIDSQVFSYIDNITGVHLSSNIPVCAGLLVMCALLLLGENFSLQKKKETLK